MGKRMTIPELAEYTGLSQYAIRTGCKQGRYPHIKVGNARTRQKYLIDVDLFEEYLAQEACDNVKPRDAPEVTVDYGMLRKVQA